MNNKAHLRPKDFDSNGDIIPMACKEERRCGMKYIVDIKGEIEGDYEIIGKYEERPQGDLISREALKKAIIEHRYDYVEDNFFWTKLFDIIDNAPTVDIKDQIAGAYNEGYMCGNKEAEKARPQGKWIFHKDYNESCRYSCNQCGNLNNIPHNFCPNCGAKMNKEAVTKK